MNAPKRELQIIEDAAMEGFELGSPFVREFEAVLDHLRRKGGEAIVEGGAEKTPKVGPEGPHDARLHHVPHKSRATPPRDRSVFGPTIGFSNQNSRQP
jgi:hypothetical protein